FVSDAGVFHEPAAAPQVAEAGFERRLRRALGDDYELLEEIGAGGFGRVFRARDLGLEREVAIKVLHPSLTADLGVVERFRCAATASAAPPRAAGRPNSPPPSSCWGSAWTRGPTSIRSAPWRTSRCSAGRRSRGPRRRRSWRVRPPTISRPCTPRGVTCRGSSKRCCAGP